MAYYTIKDLNQLNHKDAKRIAQRQGTQRQRHRSYSEIKKHPLCSTKNCGNTRTVMDYHWTSGAPIYRPVCAQCHQNNTVMRYRAKTKVTWIDTIGDIMAHKAGFDNLNDYLNSKHTYRKYRKDYCENRDARLGFTCTTTIVWKGMLDTDHIDGDPSNDDASNMQTLCKCCHSYKTHVNEDYASQGRKALGIR